MASPLSKLSIHGFKSIEALDDFDMGSLNVLIGGNGAGKSNFVDFFCMLRAMTDAALQQFVQRFGGGDGFLFMGPKRTRQIKAHLEFGKNAYEFDLEPTADGGLQILDERVQYTGGPQPGGMKSLGRGNRESQLKAHQSDSASSGQGLGVPYYVFESVSKWTVYHFHDTSLEAGMRREHPAIDQEELHADGSNIAPFLLYLQTRSASTYDLIRDTVRLTAPFFDDFRLKPQTKGGEEKLRLDWRQKGSRYPFSVIHLSDGMIRFVCLATALLQPNPPATIVIDEPELGLHPFAINILADLVQSAAERTQVIVSTQSPALLDHVNADDVIVVIRRKGGSEFTRLDPAELKNWLEEYSIGELWQKNVVQGGPGHE